MLKMQGLYNPEKDQTLKDIGNVRSQLGEFMGEKVKAIENQIEEKLVRRIEGIERNIGTMLS